MISGYFFLGIGLADNTPEWGVMLSNSKQYLYSNPMLIMYPGLCILLTSAAGLPRRTRERQEPFPRPS